MADPRVSFPVLEDAATQAGLPLHKVLEGDAAAAKNALPALIAKDISGNLRYPLVDAQRRLSIVTNVNNEACLSARGELAAGNAAFTLVTGAIITLVADLTYTDIGFLVSCTRDSHFQIVQTDDVTDTILADVILEAGQSVHSDELHCLSFVAGSTGTQTLKLMAKNFNMLSALRGTLTVTEVQP